MGMRWAVGGLVAALGLAVAVGGWGWQEQSARVAAERDAAEETAGALREREAEALQRAEAKARDLKRAQSEAKAAQERLDQAANAAKALQQQNNALAQDVQDANAGLNAANAGLAQANANLAEFNADWSRALAQMNALERLNRRLDHDLRAARAEIERLRTELAKYTPRPQPQPQPRPPHGGPGHQRPGYDLELDGATGRAVVSNGR